MSRLTFFSPAEILDSRFLGFDRLFSELEQLSKGDVRSANFPPVNIYRDGEAGYTIELALAGYKRGDVKVEHDRKKGLLTVTGEGKQSVASSQAEDGSITVETRQVVRQGIATRSFTRVFTMADDLEVASASLEDGMLTIVIKKVIREEDKPLLIAVK